MMKRALFILQAPKLSGQYASITPPLGILGLASYLESKGIPSDVIDYNITKPKSIDYGQYTMVCFGVMISNISNSLEQIKAIKEESPKTKIIIGGPYVKSDPEFFLNNPDIDALILGEAEETLHEFLTKEDPRTIKGLYLRDTNGKPFFTGNRPFIKDLDALPFPALDKVDIRKYNWPIKKSRPISTMVTSRGCPELCTFCSHALGFAWRSRSAKHVVDEIEWQVNELGVKEIAIFDDNFTLNMKRAEDICDLIKERKIEFNFQLPNGVRADKLNYHLLKKLKDAGCWYLALAPESGNEDTLVRIKKRFSLSHVEQAVRDCRKVGIKTMGLFMIGLPFESREHIERTIAFSQRLDTDFAQFAKVTLFPETELAQEYLASGHEVTKIESDRSLKAGYIEHEIPGIPKEDIPKYIQKAYRGFYLRPRKMFNIYRTLQKEDIIHLMQFAIGSKNM